MRQNNVGLNVGMNVGLNKREKAVFGILIENSNTTTDEFTVEIGVTKRTIEKSFVKSSNR